MTISLKNTDLKAKFLNAAIVVASLFGYLEWGGENSNFLYVIEAQLIGKLFTNPASVLHPLTLLPLAGQVLLVITLFQAKPSKKLTIAGMVALAVLFFLILFIGIIGPNYKILLSSLPFIVLCIITLWYITHNRRTN